MSTRLEAKWDALEPDAMRPVFQLFDASHPLPFYVGREADGNRSLLLLCDPPLPALSGMRFVAVRAHERGDGRLALVLSLQSSGLEPVFSLLCEDLIESSRHITDRVHAARFVIHRLEKWRKLLEREMPGLLGEEKVRGLFAELFFLQLLIAEIGAMSAVEAWVGPLGADQDFQCPERVWEIKAVRPDAEAVRIASECQLLSTGRQIQLVVLTLAERSAEDNEALGLNAMVSRCRTRLLDDPKAADLFEERLLATGYVNREAYDRPVLSVAGAERFQVDGSFPRILPAALPEGVFDVAYKIRLAVCRQYLID